MSGCDSAGIASKEQDTVATDNSQDFSRFEESNPPQVLNSVTHQTDSCPFKISTNYYERRV